MSGVDTRNRYKRGNPCPICGGYDEAKRGQGERCYGFLSADGRFSHCSREELAGPIQQESYGTYAHLLQGECYCGKTHGATKPQTEMVGATYDYRSADRTLLYQVIRKVPKGFYQRKPDGNGGWLKTLRDVERVPYRLPEMLSAVKDDPQTVVWIGEGETCAETLVRLGFVATTNSEGAEKWRPSLSEHFKGLDVVIVADNDDVGRKHVGQVSTALLPIASRVRVITDLPVKEKGDVVDLAEAMGDDGAREFLLTLAADTKPLGGSREPILSVASPASNGHPVSLGNVAIKMELDTPPISSTTEPSYGLPEIEKFGSGWKASVADAVIEISRVKEESSGVFAEVAVYRHGARSRILRLNLGAPTSVKSWGEKILQRKWDDFPLRWEDVLPDVFDAVIDASRSPTPLINLGQYKRDKETNGHLIAPLFPYRDITILFGSPGGSKSRIALASLLCYTEGLTLPGTTLCKPKRPGVYFDFEWNEDKHSERLEAMCHWLRIDLPSDLHYRRIRRRLPDEIDAMKRQVDELGAGFVVIDSLGLAARGNMQSDEIALEVMGAILELEVTTCVIGQITKEANNGQTKASPFGSIFWEYSARQTWEVKSTREEEDSETVTSVLWSRKTNGKPIRKPVAWEITQTDGYLGFESTGSAFKKSAEESLCDAIVTYLRSNSLATTKEIGIGVSRTLDEVRNELWRHANGKGRDCFAQVDVSGSSGSSKQWSLQ